jgi:17beta-estradiol 17-dehydrogenase / very-long-chain 3-oxoacyl-CoA reductase
MCVQDFIARANGLAGPYAMHTFAFFGAATIVVVALKLVNAFLSLFILSGTNVSN